MRDSQDEGIKYAFAVSNETGDIVHVDEVEKGLNCNCRCLYCKEQMLAKKGTERVHHFAHKGDTGGVPGSCASAKEVNEKALHRMAKEIIQQSTWIRLPSFSLPGDSDPNCNRQDERQEEDYHCVGVRDFYYDRSEIEKQIEGSLLRPDITLFGEDKKIYVEIKVSHAVGDKKAKEIIEKKLSCIEIDISDFDWDKFDREELKRTLIERVEDKRWIYHYNQEQFLEKLAKRNRGLQKEWVQREEEKRKREEEERKKRIAKEKEQKELEETLQKEWEEAEVKRLKQELLLLEIQASNKKLQEEQEEAAKERLKQEKREKRKKDEEKEREVEEYRKTLREKARLRVQEEEEIPNYNDFKYNLSQKLREILDKLNEEQLAPVLQTEGAVLVLAGAGSGKTRVLVSRIAYLVEEKGVNPAGILAITFTNKAANEMKERLFGVVPTRDMWVCTIHSMCVRILRDFSKEAGIEKNFSIYSETERNNILKKSFQECGYEDEKLLKNIKYHVGNAKTLGFDPDRYAEEFAGESDIEDITKVYKRYQKHLKENNALDFDDLLNETRNLLARNKEALEYLSGRFRYILVDEFQDTNGVQYEIVKLLSTVHGNLFVVGDDDQSIYGWRGAKIENILHFEKDFKGAKVFKLQRNYRSTKQILNFANEVIQNNGRRKQKILWTENDEGSKPKLHEADEESGEARYVAQTIVSLRRQGYQYKDFAVLMRLNALTRSFEQEFLSDGIPFKVFGGFKFYERKEIKDLLAYLRLISNPFDSEAAVRIINFPKRGIGAKTVETLQHYAYENGVSVYDSLFELDEIGFTGTTRQKLENFALLVNKWIKDSISLSVDELVKNIVADTEMRQVYSDNSDESINKLANVEEFINAVDEFCRLNPQATLSDYLAQVTLSTDTDEMDDSDYVTLATIHAVKGLEFGCVFISGLEKNIMPVSRAANDAEDMEEERRLMYVAITRAKEHLYLTRSKSRFLYGNREPSARSCFIKELSSLLDLPKERPRYDRYSSYDDDNFYDNSNYGAARFNGGRYGNNSSYGYQKSGYGYGNSTVKRSVYKEENYNTYSPGNPSVYGGQKESGFTYGGSVPQKPKVEKKVDINVFQIGTLVSHTKFGTGTIVGVHGAGNNTIVDVAFSGGYGIKQLSASIAPLTILK